MGFWGDLKSGFTSQSQQPPGCRVHGDRYPGCPLDMIERTRAAPPPVQGEWGGGWSQPADNTSQAFGGFGAPDQFGTTIAERDTTIAELRQALAGYVEKDAQSQRLLADARQRDGMLESYQRALAERDALMAEAHAVIAEAHAAIKARDAEVADLKHRWLTAESESANLRAEMAQNARAAVTRPGNVSSAHFETAVRHAKHAVAQLHPDRAAPDKHLALAFEHVFKPLNDVLERIKAAAR
jgi:hypothetical protein